MRDQDDSDGGGGVAALLGELAPVTEWGESTAPLPVEGRLVAFCCDETAFRSVIKTLEQVASHPPVTAILDRDITSTLGTHGRNFELAVRTQELVDSGALQLGETQVSPRLPEVVGNSEIGIVLETGFEATTVRARLSSALRRHVLQHVREASLVSVYAPGRTELIERFDEAFGPGPTTDLKFVLEEASSRPQVSVDPATVLTLIGARHEISLRDLREVAEELNVSSANTLSRRLNSETLEGVFDEDTSDTQFGRPAKQLQLTDEYADAPLDDLLRFAV